MSVLPPVIREHRAWLSYILCTLPVMSSANGSGGMRRLPVPVLTPAGFSEAGSVGHAAPGHQLRRSPPSISAKDWFIITGDVKAVVLPGAQPCPQHREIIMDHRYKTGQQVRLMRTLQHRDAADGTYQITRQLPANADGERQYRVKSAREQHERVVKEGDLERA
jgi:hypothetical protein